MSIGFPMRLEFRKDPTNDTFKVVATTVCCTGMGNALQGRFIDFGEYHSYGLNHDNNINIFHCTPYPDGAVFDEMAITFCPFCGQKIECREVA